MQHGLQQAGLRRTQVAFFVALNQEPRRPRTPVVVGAILWLLITQKSPVEKVIDDCGALRGIAAHTVQGSRDGGVA